MVDRAKAIISVFAAWHVAFSPLVYAAEKGAQPAKMETEKTASGSESTTPSIEQVQTTASTTTSTASTQKASRSIASEKNKNDKQIADEFTPEQYAAKRDFLNYLAKPTERNFQQVYEQLEKFCPSETVAFLKSETPNLKDAFPKFELRTAPTVKFVLQQNTNVYTADVLPDKTFYMQIGNEKVKYLDMINKDVGVRGIYNAASALRHASLEKNFSWHMLLLDMWIPKAEASWGLGLGLAALGIGLFFGLKSMLKKTRHDVRIQGIPEKIDLNVKVDVPTNYNINTNSTINANGTLNANAQLGTTINPPGLSAIASTIDSVTKGITTSINNAVNNVTNSITPGRQ